MTPKKLRQSAFLTVMLLLLLAVVLTGATYAWFTFSAQTNVEPMSGAIGEGDGNLLIANAQDGDFDAECSLVLESTGDALRPLSTADLSGFYAATAQNRDGISILYRDAADLVNTQTLHGTVYLKSESAGCDVYLYESGLSFGSDTQALAAMRLGLVITTESGTSTYIFRLDDMGSTDTAQAAQTIPTAGTVVSSVDSGGSAVFVTDPAESISEYFAVEGDTEDADPEAGTSVLCTLTADEVASVEYWVYLEGCDDNCINVVQGSDLGLQLAFAGVPTES